MSNPHRKNKKKFFGRPMWQNSTKTIKVSPLRYYQPDSIQDVLEMVQEGMDTNTPVRAVGSGHSFSSAPKGEGILLDTDKLNKVKAYEFASKKGDFFDVQGGIKLKELNALLDKLGFGIRTMGGINHQSIAGAISTGTHGSSLVFGAMSQMVKSIVLVTHDLNNPKEAKSYRIERSGENALTDPSNYNGPELIQDDDVFHAAVVCFGSMGIIVSYVLKVEKMFFLQEKKEVSDWDVIKEKIRDKTIFKDHESVFVQVNPYPYKGVQKALVVYHDLYIDSIKNRSLQNLKKNFWYRLKRSTRSLQFELASRVPYIVWFVIWRINTFPSYVPKFLNTAVKSQKDEAYFNKGHKVMYQGLDYIKERAYDNEIVLKMDASGSYLDTLDDLMKHLQDLRNEYKIHLTSPLGLRFIKGSDVLLAPEYGEDVCFVDTPVLQRIYGGNTIIGKVQKFILAKDAKLHWGKLNDQMDVAYVKSHYPRYEEFMLIMKKYNPSKIFSNVFTKQVLGY